MYNINRMKHINTVTISVVKCADFEILYLVNVKVHIQSNQSLVLQILFPISFLITFLST